MFDRNRSFVTLTKQYNVKSGTTIPAEGAPLIFANDGAGGVVVDLCAGGAGEKFAGFSRSDNIRATTETVLESITIPVGGGVVNLAHSNLVAASARAYDVTTAAAMANVVSPPAAGEVTIGYTNGTIEFNAADAGNVVEVSYRYNLTVEQSKMKYRESLPNNIATSFFGVIDVMGGEGTVYTDQYVTSDAYAVLGTVYLESGGLVSATAGGTAIGFVTAVPAVGNGSLLGIQFKQS